MRELKRALRRRRRGLAAILAACAVGCALLALQRPEGAQVLAAAHDLPAGRVGAADFTRVRLPPGALPDGVLRPGDDYAGKVLTAPMRRGEPLTDVRLLGRASLAPGLLATPVRIADGGVAALLSPGDLIEVYAAVEGHAETVASRVGVLTRAAPGSSADGALIVVAATSAQAAMLARAQALGRVSIAIHSQ